MSERDRIIKRAVKALGTALSRGLSIEAAVGAALDSAATVPAQYTLNVHVQGVPLTVCWDGTPEDDGWVVLAQPGQDLSRLVERDHDAIDQQITAYLTTERAELAMGA